MPKRVCVVAEKGYYPGALDTELPCAGIVLNTTPPLCQRHKLGVRGHQAQGRRGGLERQRKRRENDLRAHLAEHQEHERVLQDFLSVARDFLDSELPVLSLRDGVVTEAGSEPDYEKVAYACLILTQTFRLGSREELVELLREVKPGLLKEPRSNYFLDVEKTRKRLEKAYEEGRLERPIVYGQ